MEVASFVPARLLPQMADAGEVVAHALTYPDLVVTVLAPNLRGCRDALESGAHRIVAPISVSAAHSLANVRRTPLEMVEELARDVRVAQPRAGRTTVQMIAGMSVAFGCTRQGDVPLTRPLRIARATCCKPVAMLVSLGDTTGYADAGQVASTLNAIRDIAGDKLGPRISTTPAGWRSPTAWWRCNNGIRELDSSLAGLGGCPFAPGASGNTVTEDLVFMLAQHGLRHRHRPRPP